MASTGSETKSVFIGLSGGVDSAVSASLLKKQGFDVRGIFMKCWSPESAGIEFSGECQWERDQKDAKAVADHLGIPFETWNFEKEYKEKVVDYMIEEYRRGRTPNPDVMCNQEIKFGLFFERAIKEGAYFIATGHYARVREGKMQNAKGKKNYTLLVGKDENKDQSYFLYRIGQGQLAKTMFPIGEYTKEEVRNMAKEFGLPNAERPDSQGICFVGELDIREFLKMYIPEKKGEIVTSSGKHIGSHIGLPFYTIGQRRGMEIGGGIPYYVAKKESQTNTLLVAEGDNDPALYSKQLEIEDIHWISGGEPKLPLKCEARIRYRQPLQSCRVSRGGEGLAVEFNDEQRAVTPGQSVVFYRSASGDPELACPEASRRVEGQGEEVLGGGVIT